MSDTQVSLAAAERLGLLTEEFERILEIMGRMPNFIELSIFSVMWSERCSFKNSILQLKTLPNVGEKILAGTGEERSGLIDLGNAYMLAFKMEANMQPTATVSEQGTTVGSRAIHRSTIAKGAIPIAALNSLRLGEIDLPQTQDVLKGLLKDMGDYGHVFGIPMMARDIYFDPSFNKYPLINTMSVGLIKKEDSVKATAIKAGNPVFMLGSSKASKGNHEVSFSAKASNKEAVGELLAVEEAKPLTEKLLLEVLLEALERGLIAGIQDMGAGGLTYASTKIAARAKGGIKIWLDKVPRRKQDMQPYEILLDEYQEDMLLLIEKGKENEIRDICEKWELDAVQIGELTDKPTISYYGEDKLLGEIPVEALVLGGGAPVYEREQKEPSYMAEIRIFDFDAIIEPIEHDRVIRHLLGQLSIASKKGPLSQYVSVLDTADKGASISTDAVVLRMQAMKIGIVVSADCNTRYVHANPEKGAMLAVAQAARNIVCSGGKPLAVSNCLNFGDPYDPEVYFQFAEAIKGMGTACSKFDTPISGGSVSLHNQSEMGPIYPTPMIGMLGTIADVESGRMSMSFKAKGEQIYLLGKLVDDLGSSEYLYSYHQRKLSPAPYVNLEEEQLLQKSVLKLIEEKAINSAHAVSAGGLIISLLESAFGNELGFSLRCPEALRKDAFLYGEAGGRAVVSVATVQLARFSKIVKECGIDFLHLGTVRGESVEIDGQKMADISDYKKVYERAMYKKMDL
ncbi:MAG: phosphoribosylformylglycinamidine synthase subunit PurL [Bacteroidota bacterium]